MKVIINPKFIDGSLRCESLRLINYKITSGSMIDPYIMKLKSIDGNTSRRYLKIYKKRGIEKLKKINFYRSQSYLIHNKDSLEDYFRNISR